MLFPKNFKFRKWQYNRGSLKGVAKPGMARITFGSYGLKTIAKINLTSRQLEAGRIAIQRYLQRSGKLWIRVFPHKPITHKAAEVPMGSGKGSVDHYVAALKRGTLIFELEGVDEKSAREAFRLASHKLPVKTKFILKDNL